ncbi:MAG: hypothetical protein ACYC27_14895 [Armatimonadota bacterium]
MFLYDEELKMIKDALGNLGRDIDFRPATDEDLNYMSGLLYPESVINFYEYAEPAAWIEINGAILNQIADMWGENENTNPGVVVEPLGFLNVGSTDNGDTYCLDLTSVTDGAEPAVVLVSNSIEAGMSEVDIRHRIARVADNFHQFLRHFAEGKLPVDFGSMKAA